MELHGGLLVCFRCIDTEALKNLEEAQHNSSITRWEFTSLGKLGLIINAIDHFTWVCLKMLD